MQIKNLLVLLMLACLMSCARPIADFAIQGEDRTAPSKIEFVNESKEAEEYEWDFGDGTKSKEVSPAHRYRSSGNYTVILRAKKGSKHRDKKQQIVIDAPEECLVEIETPFGIMIAVLSEDTPLHRDNFSKLVDEKYFDGLLFHRVIDGFMVQGGDPKSKDAKSGQPLGNGGPGYQIPAEIETSNLVHVKGALAAARLGDQMNPMKESSGSQFYIVHGKPLDENVINRIEAQKDMHYTKEQRATYKNVGGAPFLDNEYTVFGQVISGLEVIDKIVEVKKDGRDRPEEDIAMKIRMIK